MSEAIALTDFADTFAAKVNALDVPDIHPAGAVTVAQWLDAMRVAADNGRAGLVAEFVRMVNDKIALERQWYAESLQAAARLGHAH